MWEASKNISAVLAYHSLFRLQSLPGSWGRGSVNICGCERRECSYTCCLHCGLGCEQSCCQPGELPQLQL